MGTTLTGTTPQDTYDSLIKVTDNGPISATGKFLSDGLGNDSILALSTARVGLGTAMPDAMLTLNGITPYIRIERTGVPTWQIQNNTLVAAAGLSINNITNATTPFFINGTTDNVGIGTAAPAVKLDVVGQVRASTGILFGSDTAAANALDDYEEGTWTMGIAFGGASVGATYVNNTGRYTKIGRQVTASGYLALSDKGSSTGDATITGLPFANAAIAEALVPILLRLDNVSFTNTFQGFLNTSVTNIALGEITILGVASNLTNADFQNGSSIMVSVTYTV
jgi:hypothetical protein